MNNVHKNQGIKHPKKPKQNMYKQKLNMTIHINIKFQNSSRSTLVLYILRAMEKTKFGFKDFTTSMFL